MEKIGKTRLTIQGRSDGDGMEYTHCVENAAAKENSDKYNSPELKYSKNFALFPGKRKEPKFVPYEPYKAAVSPIIPSSKKCENVSTHVVIDSQKVSTLASSVIKFNSCKELHFNVKDKNDTFIASSTMQKEECGVECAKKLNKLEERINLLEREKKELQSQFQIQTEVNADLKKMLIAALGEDMQLKVQYMTEDKVRLGMNVLQFSEELGEKNEEIEKLSVQSDVWKSKFEASSVMVDELARWKVTLSQNLNQAVYALDSIIKEHKIISDQLSTTYNILRSTQTAFNPNSHIITKWDHTPQSLMQLVKEIHNLSATIQERLLGRACPRTNSIFAYKGATELTPGERSALQVLKDYDKLPLLVNQDLNSQIRHDPGKIACQILPHVCSKDTTVNCCKQCSGEIQLL